MIDADVPGDKTSGFEAALPSADSNVATFARDDRAIGHVAKNFLRRFPTTIPALVLIAGILGFGLIAPNFLTPGTLALVIQQVTVIGIVAIAQTVIILTAGIDLSVGEIMVFSAVIMGNLAVYDGWPLSAALLAGFAVAGAMGAFNGVLVAYVRLPAFIVTLGTLGMYRAIKLWYTQAESVRAVDIDNNAPGLLFFGYSWKFLGADVTAGGVALIILAVVVWYMLNRTPWGRHVHAIGDDEDSAMLSGINTRKTIVSVYAFAGLICGFAAWISIGRVGSAAPIGFETLNLDSITAVVIGGTSLFGGRGSIVGSVLGTLIVGVFSTGLTLAGVDDYWQLFATGGLVIAAVALDQWLRRSSQ